MKETNEHTETGNCWVVSCDCTLCSGILCETCHKHDQNRGECDVCAPCLKCVERSFALRETFYDR